jgi:hypothetical protein
MLREVEEALGMAIYMGGIYAADALGAFEQFKQQMTSFAYQHQRLLWSCWPAKLRSRGVPKLIEMRLNNAPRTS